jgi:transposase InsO family protein
MHLIKEAHAQGARKSKACALLGVTLRTVARWEKQGVIDNRKGASRHIANRLTKKEKQLIISTVNNAQYCDLPPCQIVPRLADQGLYIASESSIYRVLRAEKQLAQRGLVKARKHKRPEAHEATGPNQLWSWDITYCPSQVRGIYFYLYMIMDIYSRKIVGWTVQQEQSAEHAANLIQQACLDEGIERHQITLHADNGSPMKGATMLAKLEMLGIVPSFSRPSVSDDNPFSEALFKTVKYHPTFPLATKFETIFAARTWVVKFEKWYNTQHCHSGLKFITPNARHSGADKAIMKKRQAVYLQAKANRPERWSGNTRNWELPSVVTLNANRKMKMNKAKQAGEIKASI